jgi:hypothetical protein
MRLVRLQKPGGGNLLPCTTRRYYARHSLRNDGQQKRPLRMLKNEHRLTGTQVTGLLSVGLAGLKRSRAVKLRLLKSSASEFSSKFTITLQ